MEVRTVVQDRRRLFRDGLTMLLQAEPDIDVMGAAATPSELLELCDIHRPGVVVVQADGAMTETVRTVTTLRRLPPRLVECFQRRPLGL